MRWTGVFMAQVGEIGGEIGLRQVRRKQNPWSSAPLPVRTGEEGSPAVRSTLDNDATPKHVKLHGHSTCRAGRRTGVDEGAKLRLELGADPPGEHGPSACSLLRQELWRYPDDTDDGITTPEHRGELGRGRRVDGPVPSLGYGAQQGREVGEPGRIRNRECEVLAVPLNLRTSDMTKVGERSRILLAARRYGGCEQRDDERSEAVQGLVLSCSEPCQPWPSR